MGVVWFSGSILMSRGLFVLPLVPFIVGLGSSFFFVGLMVPENLCILSALFPRIFIHLSSLCNFNSSFICNTI